MISRRNVLRGLMTGAAAGLASAFPRRASAAETRNDTAGLFDPIRAGRPAGFGWSVESISPPIAGALFLNLIHESGLTARLRVCRRDREPLGVAQAGGFDFVIMRRKSVQTEETLGRAVLAIASAAGKNERRFASLIDQLKTHKEHLASCRV